MVYSGNEIDADWHLGKRDYVVKSYLWIGAFVAGVIDFASVFNFFFLPLLILYDHVSCYRQVAVEQLE